MENSINKKIVRVNLKGIINDQYNDLQEEEKDIITSLLEILDRRSDILIGDVFCILVPGNRINYYNIFKNFHPITKKEYNQYLKRNKPKPQVDYSNQNYHRVYDPKNENSLLEILPSTLAAMSTITASSSISVIVPLIIEPSFRFDFSID